MENKAFQKIIARAHIHPFARRATREYQPFKEPPALFILDLLMKVFDSLEGLIREEFIRILRGSSIERDETREIFRFRLSRWAGTIATRKIVEKASKTSDIFVLINFRC
jgi:hypothetical protein